MHRLRERTVAGGIPNGKADPFFSRRVEGNAEGAVTKGRLSSRGNDFAAHLLAVTPNGFDELERKSPFHVSNHLALRALAFDGPILNEDFAGRDKKVARPQCAVDRRPVFE